MKTIGEKLRQARISAGVSIEQISRELIERGLKASAKTIYSWENSNSQPIPDALLYMCERYRIADPLTFFGYHTKKEPPTTPNETADDPNLKKLLSNYNNMNLSGQYELAKYSDFLTGRPEYGKHSNVPDEIKQA